MYKYNHTRSIIFLAKYRKGNMQEPAMAPPGNTVCSFYYTDFFSRYVRDRPFFMRATLTKVCVVAIIYYLHAINLSVFSLWKNERTVNCTVGTPISSIDKKVPCDLRKKIVPKMWETRVRYSFVVEAPIICRVRRVRRIELRGCARPFASRATIEFGEEVRLVTRQRGPRVLHQLSYAAILLSHTSRDWLFAGYSLAIRWLSAYIHNTSSNGGGSGNR